MGERELELLGEELLDVRAADIVSLGNLHNAEDLKPMPRYCQPNVGNSGWTYVDGPEASTVAGSHVLVERLDGVRTAELTELLVHVVRSGTRVVTEPDAEVLDLQRLLLVDL